jgi:glyoxylase-like metal-dependent hydrolase (beta-lactamase superfamily II)
VHTDFKFHPQVTQIGSYYEPRGHVEIYLVEGDGLTLIDTGCAGAPEQFIAPALQERGLDLKDVRLILNTHGHFDHAGGNARVVASSACQVWLPAPDAAVAADPDRQFDQYYLQDYQLTGRPHMVEAAKADWRKLVEPSPVNRALQAGEVLNLGRGIDLRVVPTPGHTRGSVCFYWEREGLLFTGDSIPGGGSRPGGLPLIYHPQDYERSIDLVETLDINVLCLGHHYVSLSLSRESVKFGRRGKRFIQESREIARVIAAAMESAADAQPGAPFLDAAASAVKKIQEHLPVVMNSKTGVPVYGGTSALYNYWLQYAGASSDACLRLPDSPSSVKSAKSN